jgi:hypothetical protein
MPIKPENAGRYPKEWKQIRERILVRARNQCEGSPAYPGCRAKNGDAHPVTMSIVVLTIAHLDHVPEHCDDDNLRAWCQRCHLTYDAKHHAQNAYATRRKNKRTLELPL